MLENPTKDEIKEQYLWKNRYLPINRKIINEKRWKSCDILFIKDILNEESKFISLKNLQEKMHCNINFMEYLHIRKIIPPIWIQTLHNNKNDKNDMTWLHNVDNIEQGKIKTKELYWTLINKKEHIPTSTLRWQKDYPLLNHIEKTKWQEIYGDPFKICKNTRVIALNYKILHRTIN